MKVVWCHFYLVWLPFGISSLHPFSLFEMIFLKLALLFIFMSASIYFYSYSSYNVGSREQRDATQARAACTIKSRRYLDECVVTGRLCMCNLSH